MTFACIFKVNNYVSFFYLTAFVHIFRNLVRCQYENLQLWPWYLGNKLTMSQVTAESCFWVTHYSLRSSSPHLQATIPRSRSPRLPWKRQSLWLFSLAVLGFIITASKYSKWLWLKKCSSEDVLFLRLLWGINSYYCLGIPSFRRKIPFTIKEEPGVPPVSASPACVWKWAPLPFFLPLYWF